MRIAVLTGGGDCPGLNNAIRAVYRTAELNGFEVVGIKNGWQGMIEGLTVELNFGIVERIYKEGGTILHSSRTNPLKVENGIERIRETMERLGIDCIIPIGGDDTLGAAYELHKRGIKVICIPKTIDKDLNATDYSIGFDTSINTVAESIDKLRTTAESHHRVMVIEVMGRESGWIAVLGGIAGAADYILAPERPANFEDILHVIDRKRKRGKNSIIIVVAEGAILESDTVQLSEEKDQFGHVRLGGVGKVLTQQLKAATGLEVRYAFLGHIQRGGAPSAYDRIVGSRLGVMAVDLVRDNVYGKMVAVTGYQFHVVDLYDAVKANRLVTEDWLDTARVFF